MKREQRYGIKSLTKDFPTEESVLEFLFDAQHSRECSCGGSYKAREGRKQYQCSKCRGVISPLVGTIFERSVVSLPDWFRSILLVHKGISIKGLQRELKTTYKTAWRVFHILQKNTRGDTIDLICKIEKKKKEDTDRNIKLNSMPMLESGTKNTKKKRTSIVGSTELKTLKNTKAEIEKTTKNYGLKLFLNTQKEYQNALAVEKEKSNFWRLTT